MNFDESSQKQSLGGTGIVRNVFPGCSTASLNDFIDLEAPLAKRVEPMNCAIVRVSTPVLSWAQPSNMKPGSTFTVQLKADTPATNTFSVTFNEKYPRHFVETALGAGVYSWKVTYTKQDGSSVTSQTRRFLIPAAGLPSVPSSASFANAVLVKSHPRLLPTGSSFAAIAAKARGGEYKPPFENFLAMTPTYAAKAIPEAPQNLELSDFGGDSIKFEDWKRKLRNQILDERAIIENLGFAYHFTGNTTYRESALKRLQSLAAWPYDGASSERVQDQVNREVLLIMAIGLDLFQDRLNEPSAADIRNSMVACLKARIAQIDFESFNRYPYNSHTLTAVMYVLEAMTYAAGTPGLANDGGRADLEKYWNLGITTFASWGGSSDGAFANSMGYGWYAAASIVRFMAIMKLAANFDFTSWPQAVGIGDFLVAMSAPLENIHQAFGDEADATNHYQLYSGDTMRMLAYLTGKAEHEWYWRLRAENLTNKWLFAPLHFMLLGTSLPTPTPPKRALQFANSFLFEDAGYVALHVRTSDADRTSVFFRSSRFGSFNHSHADQNAFTFISKGKDILISGGVYDSFGSDFHRNVTRATRYKNALTFDGGIGQSEPSLSPVAPGAPVDSMTAIGRVMNFADTGVWAITSGDATAAYRGRDTNTGAERQLLSAAYRTVALNRSERVVVVYDYASSESAKKWELNFQTLASNSPAVSGEVLKITNESSSACIQVFGLPGSYAITQGYPLAPSKESAPQSQIRYNASSKSAELVSVTIIREDCRDVPVRVSFEGSEAHISVNGSNLSVNRLAVRAP